MSYDAASYLRDVQTFRAHFPHAFAGHIVAEGHRAGFPFAKLLPDGTALIGVDSNFFLPRATNLFRLARMAPTVIRSGDVGLIGENLSGSTGHVNVESLSSLLEHPDIRERRKILVMHHYLYADDAIGDAMTKAVLREMRLDNRAETIRLIKDHGIELVLHGHWHVTNAYRAAGVRVLNSGGSLWSGYHQLSIYEDRIQVTYRDVSGRVAA
jgi:3',5'-cyclic AMP phosphodiesterase CpdA